MKVLLLVAFVALEPTFEFPWWGLKSARIYFTDWSGPGYSLEKRTELMKKPPSRIYFASPPGLIKDIGNSPTIAKGKIGPVQLAVTCQYENEKKKTRIRTIYIDRDCKMGFVENTLFKPDSVVLSVYKSVDPALRAKIFKSKGCLDILHVEN